MIGMNQMCQLMEDHILDRQLGLFDQFQIEVDIPFEMITRPPTGFHTLDTDTIDIPFDNGLILFNRFCKLLSCFASIPFINQLFFF